MQRDDEGDDGDDDWRDILEDGKGKPRIVRQVVRKKRIAPINGAQTGAASAHAMSPEVLPNSEAVRRSGARLFQLPEPRTDRVFLGITDTGLLKVRLKGVDRTVAGAVYAVTGTGRRDRCYTFSEAPEFVSTGFRSDAPENSIKYLGREGTCELVRIQADFRAPTIQDKPKPPGEHVADATNAANPTRKAKKQEPSTILSAGFERIAALRAQSLEPDVGRAFVLAHVHTSRATLYRWIKEGKFPAGFMRNGNRHWLFSEVEAWRLSGSSGDAPPVERPHE